MLKWTNIWYTSSSTHYPGFSWLLCRRLPVNYDFLKIQNQAKYSCGSPELFPNKNLKQIGQGVYELQTNRDYKFLYIDTEVRKGVLNTGLMFQESYAVKG